MWVCSAHQDIEVNSKGKGCSRCQNDHEKYLEKRRAKKRRREENSNEDEED